MIRGSNVPVFKNTFQIQFFCVWYVVPDGAGSLSEKNDCLRATILPQNHTTFLFLGIFSSKGHILNREYLKTSGHASVHINTWFTPWVPYTEREIRRLVILLMENYAHFEKHFKLVPNSQSQYRLQCPFPVSNAFFNAAEIIKRLLTIQTIESLQNYWIQF